MTDSRTFFSILPRVGVFARAPSSALRQPRESGTRLILAMKIICLTWLDIAVFGCTLEISTHTGILRGVYPRRKIERKMQNAEGRETKRAGLGPLPFRLFCPFELRGLSDLSSVKSQDGF